MKLGILIGSILPVNIATDEVEVNTDHGRTSSGILESAAGPHEIRMIGRHGVPPLIPPHKVNHKANMIAFKEAGVDCVISICSTGALRKDIPVPSMAVPDDYVDFFSEHTFIDDRIHHVTPGLNGYLQAAIAGACRSSGFEPVTGVTYVQMKGPRLETRAEIKVISGWGDLVGMNMGPEATLSRELDIPFGSLLTVDNHANGILDGDLDYREILDSARTRYEDVMKVISALEDPLAV